MSKSVDILEERRIELQKNLDDSKDLRERNVLGQYSTPFPLACSIVEYALSLMTEDKKIYFLEPSIGTGVFYSALSKMRAATIATGIEIDPHYYKPATELWKSTNLRIENKDFLKMKPERKYNLILANPPYSRHHHINSTYKRELQQRVEEYFGINISGLAGLYCYFMILSTLWLEEGGISSWLVPSEFLDVNYGEALRRFLCEKVELISIHRFEPEDVQFSDALVSSSVVTFRRSVPKGCKIVFTSGGSLSHPCHSKKIAVAELEASSKWSHLFQDEAIELEGPVLGDFFKVSRGVSTGNNSFFILSQKQVEERKLPKMFLRPILSAPRHLKETIIKSGRSNMGEKDIYYLLSCPLQPDCVKNIYPSLYDYIHEGEENHVNEGHNCQRRTPWYSGETRQVAPIYMTYMGRGDNHERMFRFILNESDSIVTNSYLMLYPKKEYQYCFRNKDVVRKVWKLLSDIPKERLVKCGRSYGGGLFKIEPKELESLPVPELSTILKPQQLSLF